MTYRATRSTFRFLLLLTITAGVFHSCNKDDASGSLSLSSPTLYFDAAGQTQTISFTADNLGSITVSSTPTGWTAEADLSTLRMTVTAPPADEPDAVSSGTIKLVGYINGGKSASAELFVAIAGSRDLAAEQSNCYILNRPDTYYTFNAMVRGEGREALATARIEVIWQTAKNLIRYLELDEQGRATFFIGSDDGQLPQGNALVGAYDAEERLIWSWHLWVADYDPSAQNQTYANGMTFMTRNLGASANANATEQKILASYGLYYQWGRREPFVGPYAYDCASGKDADMYNGNNSRTYLSYVESGTETGTEAYALANPMTFILGVEESGFDWLYASHSDDLWGGRKTLSDPCPKGWRVPDKEAFEGLVIADDLTAGVAAYQRAYGWHLTDGSVTAFYLGAGRRSAVLGTIQNINTNEVPKPWVGCYWTTGAGSAALTSSGLYFTLDTEDAMLSEMRPQTDFQRANGLQVRCVKDE